MMGSNMSSDKRDPESHYRDMVWKELVDTSEALKEIFNRLNDLADKSKTLEIVLIGYEGKNGLRSKVEELSKKLGTKTESLTKKLDLLDDEVAAMGTSFEAKVVAVSSVLEGDQGLKTRMSKMEDVVDKLRVFKIKVVAYSAAAQTFIGGVLFILSKAGVI